MQHARSLSLPVKRSVDTASLRGDSHLCSASSPAAGGCGDASRAATPPPPPIVRLEPVVERDVPISAEWDATLVRYISVPGHPEIFVIGDTASLDPDGHPLPGVAQVAMQQGRYAGMLIHRGIVAKSAPPPLHYFDNGTMVVVGKGFAVLQSGRLRGFLAWPASAAVHLAFLAQSSLRVSVFVQCVWTYVTRQRGPRPIVNHHAPSCGHSRPSTLFHEPS